jgi:hypothetical protein
MSVVDIRAESHHLKRFRIPMSSVGTLSDKSPLLSTVQMDDSQQHPSYHVRKVLSTIKVL